MANRAKRNGERSEKSSFSFLFGRPREALKAQIALAVLYSFFSQQKRNLMR